ncbi:hypothetical protein [Undibacterium squillarum]|uniref:hypothetical protein n=1 Tax=Undibacterium squillarum TaxID=1131567 RepID=UPI0035B4C3FC
MHSSDMSFPYGNHWFSAIDEQRMTLRKSTENDENFLRTIFGVMRYLAGERLPLSLLFSK